MGAYADYNYYTTQYYGDRIPEDVFQRYARWSSALIDRLTSGRIRQMESVPDCVRDAMCAAADVYYLEKKKGENLIRSESNDGYSVSFGDAGKEDVIVQQAAMEIRSYLGGSDLLFRGGDCCEHEC